MENKTSVHKQRVVNWFEEANTRKVGYMLSQGMTIKQISGALGISERRVKLYAKNSRVHKFV